MQLGLRWFYGVAVGVGVLVGVGVGVGGLSTWSNATEGASGTTIPAYLNAPISNV